MTNYTIWVDDDFYGAIPYAYLNDKCKADALLYANKQSFSYSKFTVTIEDDLEEIAEKFYIMMNMWG